MSNSRAEMKGALKNLNAATPLRIPSSLAFTAPVPANARGGMTELSSPITEERGSKTDPVKSSPGENLTRSISHPLSNAAAETTRDFVDLEAQPSDFDPVSFEQAGTGFTAVPHGLLRAFGLFDEPIDFMIYMHLFTYSWGYNRKTANMGLTQLERYTGASRNTVRQSLRRLIDRKWIKEAQPEEKARITRKWLVRNPVPRSSARAGSKTDPVKNSPGENLTTRGSNSDPVTGSKIDPYIEISKQSFKETLSLRTGELRAYFESIKEPRKRESEWSHCQGLLEIHSESDVVAMLRRVQARGIGDKGEVCHSPMAYLAVAIGSELAKDRAESKVRSRIEAELRAQEEKALARAQEEREAAERVAAFERAHPDESLRRRVINQLTIGVPFNLESARVAVAAARWWESLHRAKE
jgi:hypothetical protein